MSEHSPQAIDYSKDAVFFVPESEVESAKEPEASKTEEAFNEETGEINWDCPCLGPMTQPPCGDTFKAAFSCFVYSKEEPKGADCVDLFRSMQDCFREHPEIYGAELEDEDQEPKAKEDSQPEQDIKDKAA